VDMKATGINLSASILNTSNFILMIPISYFINLIFLF
jgi:hypothetical protein